MIMSEQSAAVNAGALLQRCTTTFQVTMFQKGKTNQVLFLEAGKDFVDTLLSFLLLPVGTIHHIVSQLGAMHKIVSQGGLQRWNNPQSGISSIFESVDFLKLHVDKQDLVQRRPSAPECTACGSSCYSSLPVLGDLEAAGILQRPPPERQVLSKYYFKCSSQEASHSKSGFVEETSTKFIITDELEIRPSTTMTIMNALKKLQLASEDDVESSEIAVSINQILHLLHSALTSKTCLNDVFGSNYVAKQRRRLQQLLLEAPGEPR